ncbi:MAG: 2-oxoacid:acceptor oxidoreductase subunit alpha [Bacteroidota bacterium]|uniref:2-oxoacid:acceptor oxidoreductase subunit alpha n=1 Tax=Flagellimonas profundi TaxID=2915620 RepID=A0ABS3FC44_9FLAO|nr:2-oxoacid:acceptor oxidoreductase subunit alpha [Allomuricauda profundi]MBO0340598.1 2-oxoacid:acceptor oxidoreductase subunit alpha [Allomuricauda profundi]MEC7772081.1 2-oxoacid:acceptor oxidoreductase subunit alpha [Bacteroidota bacterium]
MDYIVSSDILNEGDRIKPRKIKQAIVEIVSDSGEGAQKCGQSFGAISAKMGNGVWTVEIIPAEIQPPARSREGASGIRVRIGSDKVTNMGNHADLVIALNEQVVYGRIRQDAYNGNTLMFIENKWAKSEQETIRQQYSEALLKFKELGIKVVEIPMEEECLKLMPDPRKGKNMWILGLLSYMYDRDIPKAEDQIRRIFKKKTDAVIDLNIKLLHAGYDWARENLPFRYEVTPMDVDNDMVVMNGNEALSMGIMASGIELCSMYPITPATSVSHHLAENFERVGGIVHQAEDEISAIGFAIGASFAGKPAVTVTSGPGLALKTEFIGLAVMAEIPLVIIDVQRGGPSTGLPTKVEQSDLLAAIYGEAGDAPKIVLAAATIEECFHFVVLARKLAESFRTPVILLSDANLATGVQPFPRPKIDPLWLTNPIDQSPWKDGAGPFEWDENTGTSKRPIPGQKGGMYTVTGLAHGKTGKVAYDPEINQASVESRSRKIASFQKSLKPPKINGDPEGDILLVGWGSTLGAIEEAVADARAEGLKVSSLHLRFLFPIVPGLVDIFNRFKKVITVEINYSDTLGHPMITQENRRYAQLAWLLRAKTHMDIDCFSNVYGQPLNPEKVLKMIKSELKIENSEVKG